MGPLFETVTDLAGGAEVIRRRRYGMIEAAEGEFRRVVLRPVPKLASLLEILLLGRWHHRRRPGDRCRLYYNQPRRLENFLAVTYVVSSKGASWATLRRASEALDQIARLKATDAMVCDAANARLSAQMLARWGWQPHKPSRWHRHYIKRFYGIYPPVPGWVAPAGGAPSAELLLSPPDPLATIRPLV